MLVLHLTDRPFSWPFAAMLAWFATVTLGLLSWQERAWGPAVQPFIRRFMGGMVLKLLGSMVLLFVLVRSIPEAMVREVASTFLLLYLAYLAFTTIWLVGRMRSIPRT